MENGGDDDDNEYDDDNEDDDEDDDDDIDDDGTNGSRKRAKNVRAQRADLEAITITATISDCHNSWCLSSKNAIIHGVYHLRLP